MQSKKSESRDAPASAVTATAPTSELRTKAASIVELPEMPRASVASLPGVVLDGAPIDTPEALPAQAGPAPDEAADAIVLAAYGEAPATLAVAGLYTMRVHWRRRALREELSELRRAANDASYAGHERLAAARKRDVRLRELALRSYDRGAYKRGTTVLALAASLLLVLLVALFRAR